VIELLIIKAENNYYRFDGNSYSPCSLSKGSVFTLERVEEVEKLCITLQKDGITGATIKKLTIVEEPFIRYR